MQHSAARAPSLPVLLVLLATGCPDNTHPAVAPVTSADGMVALCLAPTPGEAALDAELTALASQVKRLPRNADLWVRLGRGWVQQARNAADPGFYLHADACAQQALRVKPQYPPALNLRALSLLNGHRFAEARDLARQMLEVDREDTMALGTLSDALLELGDIQGAERATQQMMDLKPNLPSYARASYLLWLRGDESGALEAIRLAWDAGRGQRDHEPSAWVITEAAHIFRMRGDIAGARAGYEHALQEKADYAPALVGRARCLLAQAGDDDTTGDAIAALTTALELQPLVETAWLLGDAQARAGNSAAANAAWARARRLGQQTDARTLALFLATKNLDLDVAGVAAQQDKASRGGIYSLDVQALVAFRQGHMLEARRLMDDAMAHGTPDPRLKVHHALIAGDKEAMLQALEHGGAADITLTALAKEVL